MSEHWKSTPKYWCKHCTIYVKDTPFERKQHENTGKHQGNLRRFLQSIQKDHAKNEREKENAKAEVARLNRIAGTASGSTPAAPVPSSTSAFPKSSQPSSNNLSPADQKRQWAQLAEMGIAVPEHARSEMAMAGDWQTISKKIQFESDQQTDDKLNIGIRKRKYDDDEESEEAAGSVIRKGWGSTTRTYPARKPADSDLDALLSHPLVKKVKEKDEPIPDHHAPTPASNTLIADPPAIKSEVSDTIDKRLLVDAEAPEMQSARGTSSHASEKERENLDANAKVDDQAVFVPVFKKRKARLPPVAKV